MKKPHMQPKYSDDQPEEPQKEKNGQYEQAQGIEHEWGVETIVVNGQPMTVTFPLEDK